MLASKLQLVTAKLLSGSRLTVVVEEEDVNVSQSIAEVKEDPQEALVSCGSSCMIFYKEQDLVPISVPEEKKAEEKYVTDDILADSRRLPTVTDQVVLTFVDVIVEHIVKKWEGQVCRKKIYKNTGEDEKKEEKLKVEKVENKTNEKDQFEKRYVSAETTGSQQSEKNKKVIKREKESLEEVLPQVRSRRSSKLNTEKRGRGQHSKDRSVKFQRHVSYEESDEIIQPYLDEDDLDMGKDSEIHSELEPEDVVWIPNIPDEEVHIKFKNGNIYEGRVSRKMMEGFGKFMWTDGTIYTGNFENNSIMRNGEIVWSDMSSYSGDFHMGSQHGAGIFICPNYKLTYIGDWEMGNRHGKGIVYCGVKNDNYYDGLFVRNQREGQGIRHYSSGVVYIGYWHNDKKEGIGTMVWPGAQIYRGEWKNDVMDGYGEHTWEAFLNQYFAYPQQNTYCGNWKDGKQHGLGYLYTAVNSYIKAIWSNGIKSGYGFVVFPNGSTVESQNLFKNNNPAIKSNLCQREILTSLSSILEMFSMDPNKSLKILRSIPIHKSSQNIDLSYHITRWLKRLYRSEIENYRFHTLMKSEMLKKYTSLVMCKAQNNLKKCEYNGQNIEKNEHEMETSILSHCLKKRYAHEKRCLTNVIIRHLPALHKLYNSYATLACDKVPNFDPLLIRIMLWQLYRDCGIQKKGLTLSQLDSSLAENSSFFFKSVHDPFEEVYFWQFLHSLLNLAWFFHCENKINFDDTFASVFEKVLVTEIYTQSGNHTGSALFELRNIIPLHAMYLLYRSYGEPLPVRKLLKLLCARKQTIKSNNSSPLFYLLHVMEGTNVIDLTGDLMYLPGISQVHKSPEHIKMDKKSLSILNFLTANTAFKYITDICPGIKRGKHIVNMDYPLNFLEFYEILLLCTKHTLGNADNKTKMTST